MKAFDATNPPPAALDAPGPGPVAGPDAAAVFPLHAPSPRPGDDRDGSGRPGSPARRDRRERALIASAAALACLALGTSLVALNRDVPFLDVSVERASAQGELSSPLAATVPTRPATTTSTAHPTTTAAPVSTSTPELLSAVEVTVPDDPDPTEQAAGGHAGDGADGADPFGDADAGADAGDAEDTVDGRSTDTPWPATTASPVSDTTWPAPTPATTAPPTDTPNPPTTAPPGPASTTAPSTTVPAAPVLLVAMGCKHDTAGLTLTLAANGDGTLQKVSVRTFANGCRRAKAKVTLTDANGTVLGELTARVRGSAPYNLEVTGWSGVPAAQVATVTLTDG